MAHQGRRCQAQHIRSSGLETTLEADDQSRTRNTTVQRKPLNVPPEIALRHLSRQSGKMNDPAFARMIRELNLI